MQFPYRFLGSTRGFRDRGAGTKDGGANQAGSLTGVPITKLPFLFYGVVGVITTATLRLTLGP